MLRTLGIFISVFSILYLLHFILSFLLVEGFLWVWKGLCEPLPDSLPGPVHQVWLHVPDGRVPAKIQHLQHRVLTSLTEDS